MPRINRLLDKTPIHYSSQARHKHLLLNLPTSSIILGTQYAVPNRRVYGPSSGQKTKTSELSNLEAERQTIVHHHIGFVRVAVGYTCYNILP